MAKGIYFPPDYIEKIKDLADLAEIASSYTQLKRHGKNHQGCCPFHEDKNPSFSVNSEKQIYTCFSGCEGSGGSGDVFQFIMRAENLSFQQSVEFIARRMSIPLPEQKTYQKSASEIARENTLKNLFEIFTSNATDDKASFEKLVQTLKVDVKTLERYEVKIGYTSNAASEINSAYKDVDQSGIYEAQKLGLLNSSGKAPFSDDSLAFMLGDTISEGLGFIDNQGEFTYIPIKSHQLTDHVFGLKHFNKHAYYKDDGMRRIVGDRVYVASSPLMALQILSKGVPNVVSPFHHASYSLSSFTDRISRFANKSYFPAISYITTDELIASTDVVSAICSNDISSVPLVLNFTAPIDESAFSFLKQANECESYLDLLDHGSEYHSKLKLISPAELLTLKLINSAIEKSGIVDAAEIFDDKRSAFLRALTDEVSSLQLETTFQNFIVDKVTSKLGINKTEILIHKYPGIDMLAKKRAYAVSMVLAAAICDAEFASLFASDSIYTSIEALPRTYTGNEKLKLATYAIETSESAKDPLFNINKHIIGFPKMMHEDEPEERAFLASIIKEIALRYKNEKKGFFDIGKEGLTQLQEIESELKYDIALLINYQQQASLEQAQTKEADLQTKLDLIGEINNNVLKHRR